MWWDVFGGFLIPLTIEYAVLDMLLVAETAQLKQW
jgi:hypothetical protein